MVEEERRTGNLDISVSPVLRTGIPFKLVLFEEEQAGEEGTSSPRIVLASLDLKNCPCVSVKITVELLRSDFSQNMHRKISEYVNFRKIKT